MIGTFSGYYRFLSNFSPAQVELDGVKYPTVEHAYQAAKVYPDVISYLEENGIVVKRYAREIISKACTPGEAKRLGKTLPLRDDWEQVKLRVMEQLLRQKFAPGTKLAQRLLETDPQELVEGNTWGDHYWGACGGRGENHLGKLLMAVRTDLKGISY